MSHKVVGLDIGTHAVTAAELRLGRAEAITVVRFGQVALRPGAVVAGEVVDAGEVGAAIKRLWRETGFSTKKVIVGVGSQRVVMRPTEMPAMSDADLRSAIEFQAQELVPIPLEDAILDYQVLERFLDAEGAERLKVLIVAAQKGLVNGLLGAVAEAGLEVSLVDLVPFALLRSLADVSGFADLEPGASGAEAIVSIGAGITTVVVHEFGIPRFLRTMVMGGQEVTQAIADEFGITLEQAESLKRRAGLGIEGDPPLEQVRTVVARRAMTMVDEINGSLEFYSTQPDSVPLRRIVLIGGGRRLAGISSRLAERTGVPVVIGAPFARFEIGSTGLTPEQLREAEDLSAVALGLALAGRPVEKGARRLSLMPPEIGERKERNRQVAAAGAGLMLLAAGLFWLGSNRRSQVDVAERKAAGAEAEMASLQSQIAELIPVADFESQVQQRRALVEEALSTDVAWSKLIQEVATVMPDDVWLSSFVGSAPDDLDPGTFTVSGKGFDHTSSARWLLRVEALDSVSSLWLPSSVRKPEGEFGELSEATFASSGTLTDKAASNRLADYLESGEGPSVDLLGSDPTAEPAPGESGADPVSTGNDGGS